MIAQLTGRLVEVRPTSVVIDVGGVGFLVSSTLTTTAGLSDGAVATLHTHLAVREDALTLYGFATPEERDTFVLVQSVSGIGPKLAAAVVTHLTPPQLRQAILAENVVALSKVPGVGAKTASRLILELKDKAPGLPGAATGATPTSGAQEQVTGGLQGLGYSAREAGAAWEAVRPLADQNPGMSVAALMKAALQSLARP